MFLICMYFATRPLLASRSAGLEGREHRIRDESGKSLGGSIFYISGGYTMNAPYLSFDPATCLLVFLFSLVIRALVLVLGDEKMEQT